MSWTPLPSSGKVAKNPRGSLKLQSQTPFILCSFSFLPSIGFQTWDNRLAVPNLHTKADLASTFFLYSPPPPSQSPSVYRVGLEYPCPLPRTFQPRDWVSSLPEAPPCIIQTSFWRPPLSTPLLSLCVLDRAEPFSLSLPLPTSPHGDSPDLNQIQAEASRSW